MRYLTAGLLILAAALSTACSGSGTEPEKPGPPRDRSAVLAEVRAVDTCALYGGADTVTGHPLTVDGHTSFLGCDARVTDPDGDVDVSVALNVGTPGVEEASWVKHRTIDGVDVTSASIWDAPDTPPREQMVSGSCNLMAHYPDDVRLMVNTSAPPEVDACAVGEELLRTAMGEFADRPATGTTEFPTTVLTGGDPCAATERLRPAHRVTIDLENSTVSTCAFTVDDSPMLTVSSDYRDPALLQYSTDRFEIDGHQVAGDASNGMFDVVVGPPWKVGGETRVPVVNVFDDPKTGAERIKLVTQAVADQY